MRLALVLVTVQLLAAGTKVERDWARHPAILEVEDPGVIFAIGDVHGDLARLLRVLRSAKVIGGGDLEWAVGNAVLVCTGDFIDKGPRSLDVVRYWEALQAAAAKAGGRVIVTMGNHEAEFLAEPKAEKSAEFRKELRRGGLKPARVAACRGEVGQFLCGLPFGARVGRWFFSHAGDTHGRSVATLVADLERDVNAHGFGGRQLTASDSLLEARLSVTTKSACEHPWFECSAGRSGKDVLAMEAAALGVEHMVQGHQPADVVFADGMQRRAGEMFQRWGLLFLIDTGMSEGVGNSVGAVLRIGRESAAAICADGKETEIWRAGMGADFGRAAACR